MKLNIPKPCPENWNNMTPSENGRHCSVCEKTVVDFRKMGDKEILAYFQKLKGESVCAKLSVFQGEPVPKNRIETSLVHFYKTAHNIRFKFPRVSAVFLLGSVLTIMGCGPSGGACIEPGHEKQDDSIRKADSTSNAQAAAMFDSIHKADSISKLKK